MTKKPMDRVTLRVPARMKGKIRRLVEAEEYPTNSEAHRAGLRELFALCDFSTDPPTRHPHRERPGTTIVPIQDDPTATHARAAGWLHALMAQQPEDGPILIFDEARATTGMRTPEGARVVHSADELADVMEEMG